MIAAICGLAALPLQAQEAEGDDGFSLMERGAQMFLEGILREVEPAIKDLEGLAEKVGPDLRRFVEEMGPAFAEIMNEIGDLSAYHPPEILPNGDIILRKKTPEEMQENPPGENEIDI